MGIDGGGTRTHAAMVDRRGEVLGFGIAGPSNWELVGRDGAREALAAAVHEALTRAGASAERVAASVCGLAGIDFPSDEVEMSGIFQTVGLSGPFTILNDAFVALRAGTNHPWGIVVVAGTGSVVAGRNPAGETFRTFGQGPLLGDDGSSSEVSEAAVTAVAAQQLGRGPRTTLSDRLPERAASASAMEFLEAVAKEKIDPASFAPEVVEAADAGDPVARRILEQAGSSLGELAGYVARRLQMDTSEFELVLAGAMFRNDSRIMRTALENTVKRSAPFAVPVRLEPPPVVGAALLALELAGVPTDQDLHMRLAVSAIRAMQEPPSGDLGIPSG